MAGITRVHFIVFLLVKVRTWSQRLPPRGWMSTRETREVESHQYPNQTKTPPRRRTRAPGRGPFRIVLEVLQDAMSYEGAGCRRRRLRSGRSAFFLEEGI